MNSHIRPPMGRAATSVMIVLAAVTILLGRSTASAQSTTTVEPAYNIGDDEFLIGGYCAFPWGTTNPDSLWVYADSLGVVVPYVGTPRLGQIDTLADSSDAWWHSGRRFMPHTLDPFLNAGYGREVEFYPFDSVQSPYWQCLFTSRSGGTTQHNEVEVDPNSLQPLPEQVYDNVSEAGLIASEIRIDTTFPRWTTDLNTSLLSLQNVAADASRTYFFVLTGHLFSGGSATTTDAIFRVAVYHRIEADKNYLADDLSTLTAPSGGVELLVDSFEVTKGDLLAGFPDVVTDRYRVISHQSNLEERMGDSSLPGPLHPMQPNGYAQALDIRVYWTGAEKAALRSIAVRDHLGQLVLGDRDEDRAYQANLLTTAKRILRGADTSDSAPIRPAIMRLEVGHENNKSQYAAFRAIDRLLKQTFNKPPHATAHDSVAAVMFEGGGNPNWHHLTQQHEEYVETYFNRDYSFDSIYDNDRTWEYAENLFRVPTAQIPAIAQHDGGRYHIPELNLTEGSIEDYETTIQRAFFGRHAFYPEVTSDYPYHLTFVSSLNNAAVVMREHNRRLVQFPGLIREISVRSRAVDTTNGSGSGSPQDTVVFTDTLMTHVPEAAEIRANINLGLAYGSKGVIWWNLDDWALHHQPYGSVDRTWNCCIGPAGRFGFWDFWQNTDSITLYEAHRVDSVDVAEAYITLDPFYVGRRNVMNEVHWINKSWLTTVGPELMKLRWRDAYSIHTMVPWKESGAIVDSFQRGLPPSEIVTDVQSYPLGSQVADSSQRTFVEIAFFDKVTGTVGGEPVQRLDSHHVFIVNRRTFERPADIDSTTTLGHTMDSLAESRRIAIKFDNLQFGNQFQWIRVREVAPDSTPLPGHSSPRAALDTVLPADSVVFVTLGPGRAALLEITYKVPDESVQAGDIRFGSQRKILFDGKRYHSVYTHSGFAWIPSLNQALSTEWVYYRRSMYVTDTTGPILWEPVEYAIPIEPTGYRIVNHFPSITLRTQGSDTVATIVWTCHKDSARLDVCLRNLYVSGMTVSMGPIEVVDSVASTDAARWGTPVVSRMRDGELVAYSDQQLGIVARYRLLGTGPSWWLANSGYSAQDQVSGYLTPDFGSAQYPSVPTFTHISRGDTLCALAYQQPFTTDTIIVCAIIRRDLTPFGPALTTWDDDVLSPMSPDDDNLHDYVHPSIDQSQDLLGRTHLVVTWEQYEGSLTLPKIPGSGYPGYTTYRSRIWCRRIPLATNGKLSIPHNDVIYTHLEESIYNNPGSLFPNIASLNNVFESGDDNMTPRFTISYTVRDTDNIRMRRRLVDYGPSYATFSTTAPDRYLYTGYYPNGSASPLKQTDRFAVLYGINGQIPSTFRTSRQFYARSHPSGYTAIGREVRLRRSDSATPMVQIMVHDAWAANDEASMTMEPVEMPTSVDSVGGVFDLLRSTTFTTHDSTTVGWEIDCRLSADTAFFADTTVMFVAELVDSASGSAVAELDSFELSATSGLHHVLLEPTLDLLSGTYYLRLRVESGGFPVGMSVVDSLVSFVSISQTKEEATAKPRRVREQTGAGYRISAQPNPLTTTTELRFSVPEAGNTAIRIYDALGRPVAEPLSRSWMEPGRFSLDIDAGGLANGTYMIELLTDRERVVAKLVVAR